MFFKNSRRRMMVSYYNYMDCSESEHGCRSDAEREAYRAGYAQGWLRTAGDVVADPRGADSELFGKLLLSHAFFLDREAYKFSDSRTPYRIVYFFIFLNHIGNDGQLDGAAVVRRSLISHQRQKLLDAAERIFILLF